MCVRSPSDAELWVAKQMKSAQADAAKLQAELALTNFEGFSSDETVKATVDGSQARISAANAACSSCSLGYAMLSSLPLAMLAAEARLFRRQEPKGCDITEAAMEQGAERLSVLVNEAYADARARSLAAMKQRMLQLMQGRGR